MTVLVGIKCVDGIVIASDSSATFTAGQLKTIEQTTKKISILHGKIIVAGTGAIGLGQRFCELVDSGYSAGKFRNQSPVQMSTHMCQMAVTNFQQTAVQHGQYGALVAFPCNHEIHLAEFAIGDFQPELKDTSIWYASMGSGQMIADPFLGLMRSVFWTQGMPTLQDGIFIASWALTHAIEVNSGGVNGPLQMAVLTLEKGQPVARLLSDDELVEHKENVTGVVEHLRSYLDKKSIGEAPTLPTPPAN